MKAAVYEKRGLAGLFTFRDMEKPAPAANEVLVKIHAAAANALDYRLLRMGIGIPKRRIFGADIAGQVESVGKNVLLFRPGDEVFGDISGCGLGGFAEYVAVPESMLAKKPSGIMFEDAAALPVSGVTALQAIRDKGKVKPGHKVLIYGAGGGVGTFALQLAKYYGAAVTAVCGENNVGLAHSLGADMVIDYRREDFHVVGVQSDHSRKRKPESIRVQAGPCPGRCLRRIGRHAVPAVQSHGRQCAPILKEQKIHRIGGEEQS